MVVLDIRAKKVDEDAQIYVARPGGNYRFFELFVENNFVGPDLPGLDLPAFEDIEEVSLAAHVARAAAIRRWHLAGRREDLAPERAIDEYLNQKSSRSVSQLTRVARAYFSRMKEGDLIIVPPGSFRAHAHIGELSAPPNVVYDLSTDRYGRDQLQGRRVNWLASFPKSDLPASTLDALQKPSPLIALPRDYMPKIFRRAYGTYYGGGEYSVRFEVSSEKFRTIDDLYIQGFFNFVTENSARLRRGDENLAKFSDGAFAVKGADTPELYTNVNSPGGISLKSPTPVTIIISAMLTLAIVVGPEAQPLAEAGQLFLTNSAAVPEADQCVAEVSEQVITQLKLLGYDRWVEACQFAQAASESTGIESEATVQK